MGSEYVPGYPTLAVHKCFRFSNRIDETQISLRLKAPTESELFLQANVVHESWKFNLYDRDAVVSFCSQPILAHSRINNKQSVNKNSLWEISPNWKILDCYGLYQRFSIYQLIYISNYYLILKTKTLFNKKSINFGPKLCRQRCYSITFGRCLHGKK